MVFCWCLSLCTPCLQTVPLSAMFAAVEREKARLRIAEYSLSQTSLEQIFNSFAAKQTMEVGVARGIVAAHA